MLWLVYAVLAAVFAGATTIAAKIGVKDVDSHLATAVRTAVVLVFAWIMVFVVGSAGGIFYILPGTWFFIVISGLATGAAWLFRFRALKLGDVNKIMPIDKSSTILTMILAFVFLGEPVGWFTAMGMGLMAFGTFLMLKPVKKAKVAPNPADESRPPEDAPPEDISNLTDVNSQDETRLRENVPQTEVDPGVRLRENVSQSKFSPGVHGAFYALLAAVFASLVAIFGKIGVADIDATLWTAIRTAIVLPLACAMTLSDVKTERKTGGANADGKPGNSDAAEFSGSADAGQSGNGNADGEPGSATGGKFRGVMQMLKAVSCKSWIFLTLSGIATGASWIFFYRALQLGDASRVVPIDKLSIVVTMAFAAIFLREKFSPRSIFGLAVLTVGTLVTLL
ncbi:MAG: EamA family transporter [Defluviitaleaceae bacterium]|nr:EamA family transporter [Defluviitaleaceae bacterium]